MIHTTTFEFVTEGQSVLAPGNFEAPARTSEANAAAARVKLGSGLYLVLRCSATPRALN